MSGGASKPAIPAWQKARTDTTAPSSPAAQTEPSSVEPAPSHPPAEPESASDATDDGPVVEPASADSQLSMVDAFLADPSVKDAPIDKKRAFLQSKEVPVETIDKVLPPNQVPAIQMDDFEAFKRQRAVPTFTTTPQPTNNTSPPIITYPEFLLQAHKPPPLITPTRVLTAAYVAAGAATLLYGASKYLLEPMTDALTEARHDFSTHSQSKLDEFNERLSRLVSRQPSPPTTAPEIKLDETDDVASITSDPTELYHRDMGTQTSPLPSRQPSDPDVTALTPSDNPTPTPTQTTTLETIHSHLTTLHTSTTSSITATKESKDSMNKLRHYLDTVMYGSLLGNGGNGSYGSNLWMMEPEEAERRKKEAAEEGNGKGKADAVEELRREIRGVKGVLLGARRFPGTVGASGGG
ncbi:hypothetical protein BAUCODRAFT_127119 [Baudoinia panamericana UAMH 10762]|uniref:Peroxisome membrane anchor protein Pex14p N-terminal domain-containing protein n=1 Tax=Baudoinia panamericana (strain UAMH 10762) TaxID=717646 RepID=M2MY47_BAUPA|nr:uncharacterized protein BAUCODRAFT_127119 [Baudoinia panamericana UAMH 10762]EMC91205.1 hypothetical protein BAUCODRAFT_127119 [Baudoinia panamericana UAMH 10762]